MSKDKRLFLLDGHALVYRAHYAFVTRPLINSKGINTSAINGFVRTLWEIIKNQQPSHLAVSFDLSGKTFRNDLYPEYKANRDAQPEDITIALPYIKEIIRGFNIPIVELENYEADDVIGTLAKQAEKEGFNVYMVTPDKDYAQLVSEKIFMYRPTRKEIGVEVLGVPEILENWQIKRIDQVIDMLGLQGDKVDNIPGIPGIGPKTAVKLLDKYDTLENLLQNTAELKGKQKENVETYAEQALLSKVLATIEINAPISFDAETFKMEKADKKALGEIFKELEFRTLSQQILQTQHEKGVQADLFSSGGVEDLSKAVDDDKLTIAGIEHRYEFVDTSEKRKKLIEEMLKQPFVCFDSETTGLDPHLAELVGLSFSWEKGVAYYVPFSADQEQANSLIKEFKAFFENEDIVKRGQNIKYDAHILKWYGVELRGYFEDSMLMHYLLEPEMRHNMDYLSESYLNYKPISISTLIGKKGRGQATMRDVDPEKVTDYAAEDADITNQLVEVFRPQLSTKDSQIGEIYKTIEEPLIKVLIDMEHEGINLDAGYLRSYSSELAEKILEVKEDIYRQAGQEFNIASPRQVGDILFEKLKIPYRWRKTKTGQYSTDESKLNELAKQNEIVDRILEFRGLAKLKSTYVDSLPKMINPRDGRVHSSFNQALAATGRLSSNDPNLQNIPIKTAEGRKVREAFIPRDENHVLLAADYSQVELRLIADISNDEGMLEAFHLGQDIHRATAARVFGVPYDEVSADQRRQAKTVNFSIIYGAGATNLSQQLDIPRSQAKQLIESYFSQYRGLKSYMEQTVEFARENGYVETLMGRRRKLRDINSRNSLARSGAERVAINTPIQGTAADLIKMAMINIHNYLNKKDYKTKMILQVHDELVFDMPKGEVEELKPVIIDFMKNAMPQVKVPLLVEAQTGSNWLEAH